MAAIVPSELCLEFVNDPMTYGYQTGLGVSFSEKQDGINLVRATIQVTRKTADSEITAGEVSENIPVQLIRDSIDPDEYKLNCEPTTGDDAVAIGVKASTRDRITAFYGGSDGQSAFGFTILSKTQILDLFTNALWPTTRGNLIDLQTRDGSRAEELWGSPDAPVTRQDMLDAEAWGQANGQPSLYT